MRYIARINVESDDLSPVRAEASGKSALARAGARARHIEPGDDAVRSAHEAVIAEYFPFRVRTPATNRPDRLAVRYVGRTP